jgi:hypothetical protein
VPASNRTITIVSACMTPDGCPTFAITEVQASEDEIHNGAHYYFVEQELLAKGYEEPFVHFDDTEAPAFLHPAVRTDLQNLPAPSPQLVTSGGR